jgi:hypothetical protein
MLLMNSVDIPPPLFMIMDIISSISSLLAPALSIIELTSSAFIVVSSRTSPRASFIAAIRDFMSPPKWSEIQTLA